MLEQLFPPSWIERRSWFTFFLGFSYAVIGMGSALLLFPGGPAFPALAFTSLLVLPSLNRMLTIETTQAAAERKFDLSDPFRNHADLFRVYLFLFLGVLIAFSLFAILLPGIAADSLFSEQLGAAGLVGRAALGGSWQGIFLNNMLVFAFAILASFIYGSGAVFIIIWNASAWGVVFGSIAKVASAAAAASPFAYFFKTILSVSPHMVTEASAYVLAAIAGGVISKAVLRERLFSDRFSKVVQDALVIFGFAIALLLLAAFIESL